MAKGNSTATVLAVVVSLVVGGFGGFMLGDRMGQPEAKAVATVNGDKITETQLYDEMVQGEGKQVLDRMITMKLVSQEAKKANVTVSDAEITKEIDEIKKSLGGDAGFQQALMANNITEAQLTESIRIQLLATKILGKDIKTEEADLKKYFEENLEQFDKRKLAARHILVNTEEEAKAIKAQLDGGADFSALAKEKSIEPAAKESGGDLGTFDRSSPFDPDFLAGAFALTKGQISNPVKTQFGWHIIQVTEITGDAPDFEKMKGEVKDRMIDVEVQGKFGEWLANLKDKAKITNTLENK
ncbi:MAG: peptidyl-prolyl cis-trans isomerase [Bacillota bacterium]